MKHVNSLFVSQLCIRIYCTFDYFLEKCCDAWNDLKGRSSQGDLVRISELQQEIYILKQDSKIVTNFYYTLEVLWEELEIYMHMPNCSCRIRCSCEAMGQARKNHTLLHVVRFLTGLNDNFAVVRSQILLMKPLSSVNMIFSTVLQHERQGNFAFTEEFHALINALGNKKPYVKYNSSTHSFYCFQIQCLHTLW